ncbi:MAG: hypothetical protein LLF76_03195 [Planctomycetaceae bacterium]|nr:hypothetical protein [Planctomycetaceae bacterium]
MNEYVEIPEAPGLTADQLFGTDDTLPPTAGNDHDVVCPMVGTPCTGWDGLNRVCLPGVCLYDMSC